MSFIANPSTILKAIECEQAKINRIKSMRDAARLSNKQLCLNESDFYSCANKLKEALKQSYAQRKDRCV